MKSDVRKGPMSAALVVTIILALAMSISVANGENVLRVGPGKEYESIQAAVDAARQGSRILVYPGTYFEAVSVTKNNLQIIAQGVPGVDVIVWPPHPPAGFEVLADHITIQGFRINFGGQADCTPAIEFIGSHNTFADNYLHMAIACPGINAFVNSDPDGGSNYNTIERNYIDGGDSGMVIQSTATDAINTGDVIRDNTISGIGSYPLAIDNAEGFLVSGNRILGSALGPCIKVGAVRNRIAQGHHSIVNNTALDCQGTNGIYLFANPGTVIAHNRIAENTIGICGEDCLVIIAYSGGTVTNNEVASNTIRYSKSAGILLTANVGGDVSDNMILDNVVSFNQQSGISLTSGVDHNRILNNEVHNNDVGIAVFGDDNLIVGNWAYDNNLDLGDSGQGNRWQNNTYNSANW